MNAAEPVPGEVYRCPACGWSGVAGPKRPHGLPTWVCLQCGAAAGYAKPEPDDPTGEKERRAAAARRKAWIRRLNSKNTSIRDAEVDALVAVGGNAVAALAELLSDKRAPDRAKGAAAMALGRIGGPEAVDTLLEALSRHEKADAKRRKRVPYVVGAFLLLTVLSILVPVLLGGKPIFNAGAYVGIVGALVAAQAVGFRKGAANALAALKEPRAAGPLALAAGEKQLAGTALPILKELLPEVTEEHVEGFDGPQRTALIGLLNQKDPDIVRGALSVVALFGGEEAREPVEHLVESGPAELREQAEAALAVIRDRIAVQKDRETLLRASSSLETMQPETLLRPAAAQPEIEPQQLLRPAEESEPEG